MDEDPIAGWFLLAELEVAMLDRAVELREARERRLAARVAGRTDQVVCWVADDDEVDDDDTLAALTAFPPSAWWSR